MVVQAVATIALGLLGLAGTAKVADPQPTSGALTAAGLPSQLWLVRMLGLLELAAAGVGLGLGSAMAAPGALLYLGFAIFTFAALRADRPLQSCGCFGREDTPPSWLHFWFDVVSAFALGLVAARRLATVPGSEQLDVLLGYLAFAALGVYAAYLLLTALPRTMVLSRS